MLEALKITENEITRPSEDQIQRVPKKWQTSTDHKKFLYRASLKTTQQRLTFCKDVATKGALEPGDTNLWREMNYVTSAELYDNGPPHCEYICLASSKATKLFLRK